MRLLHVSLIVLVSVVLLSSCATRQVASNSLISASVTDSRVSSDDEFWVLFNNNSGRLVIDKISDKFIPKSDSDQEVAVFDNNVTSVRIYLHDFSTRRNVASTVCGKRSDSKYDFCDSYFTKITGGNIVTTVALSWITLPVSVLTLGTSGFYWVSIEPQNILEEMRYEDIYTPLKQYGTERIQRANAVAEQQRLLLEEKNERARLAEKKEREHRQAVERQVDAKLAKLSVKMKVTDLSGLAPKDLSALGRIQKEVFKYDYDDINQSQVLIAFYPTSLLESNFKWEIQGKPVMSYGDMQPANLTLAINSFNNLSAVKLNRSYSDSMMDVVVQGMDFNECDTGLNLRLTNLSSQHVTVSSVSLYVDDDIFTLSNLDIKLPPESTASRTLDMNSCAVTNNFDKAWTKKTLSSDVMIGIALKYDVNGKMHTLYKRNKENLSKIASMPF
ncbi:hypothetical protein [Desulfocurvibacter africanus]|uniref:Lipoprotein n=1 Tax=Desulfocurvibacter africanus subsp. africanus str. Walvis Bay TaxID=690850 RepID=F3YVQ2_DESAF|nr:hypothetical protein [Desulfocurvibacter africanus]EGJ48788.1 hypothetical protein Desaf_0433 [Desulfocurvibacter africanus subsp. africanus str. Walvis Bay]